MNPKDKTLLIKIDNYCSEIKDTHEYFKQDKNLFTNEKLGFIYRNSITMPILQIGELSKMLSTDFLNQSTKQDNQSHCSSYVDIQANTLSAQYRTHHLIYLYYVKRFPKTHLYLCHPLSFGMTKLAALQNELPNWG